MSLESRIRERAYYIWEREGRPEGQDTELWHRAATEIALEDVATSSAVAQGQPAVHNEVSAPAPEPTPESPPAAPVVPIAEPPETPPAAPVETPPAVAVETAAAPVAPAAKPKARKAAAPKATSGEAGPAVAKRVRKPKTPSTPA
jgi:hypothetical protein